MLVHHKWLTFVDYCGRDLFAISTDSNHDCNVFTVTITMLILILLSSGANDMLFIRLKSTLISCLDAIMLNSLHFDYIIKTQHMYLGWLHGHEHCLAKNSYSNLNTQSAARWNGLSSFSPHSFRVSKLYLQEWTNMELETLVVEWEPPLCKCETVLNNTILNSPPIPQPPPDSVFFVVFILYLVFTAWLCKPACHDEWLIYTPHLQ